MNFLEWSKANVEYGERLVSSAIEGAQKAEDEFLKEESHAPHFKTSACNAVQPAMLGAFLGALGATLGSQKRSTTRTLAFALLGGALGFSTGVIWENRHFTASVASGAWKRINETRDEHWFEKNPIDYA